MTCKSGRGRTRPSLASVSKAATRYQKAQIAVVMTLAMVALVGVMALGTDVAVLYYNWVQLQKAADAAVLAGANYLPNDTAKASDTAISYAKKNGMAASEIGALNCSGSGCNPTFSNGNTRITLAEHRTVPYYFARVLGLTTGTVAAASTAAIPYAPTTIGGPISINGSVSGGGSASVMCGNSTGSYDIVPIALSNTTRSYYVVDQSYTLNRTGGNGNGNGPWVDAPGNWGMVDLCGGRASGAALRSSIADGFYGPINAGYTDATGHAVSGSQLTTVPGAKVGPMSQGFADRIGASPDAFASGNTPSSFDPSDPRAVIVPMVSFAGCTGSCTVTVTGFMAFYIDSYSSGAITGHFINKVPLEVSSGVPSWNGDAGVTGVPILVK